MTTRLMSGTRWRLTALVIAVGLVAAGCIGFTVQKQVTNGTSAGPFVVHISCSNEDGSQSEDLTFDNIDGSGQQTLPSDDFDLAPLGPTTCTFTEPTIPTTGVVVTIECVSPPMGITCTQGTGTLDVVAPPGSGDFQVNIRVTNDFAGVTTTTPTTVVPPQGVPDPPTDVTASEGSVIVTWNPPANPGTSPITGYTITSGSGAIVGSVDGSTTRFVIDCAAPGTYTFTVQAVNASGASVASVPSNALAVASIPAGCTSVLAQPTLTG